MSANPIYDAIQDALISHLEENEDSKLPKSFKVALEPEAYKWMMAFGLVFTKEMGEEFAGKQLPKDAKRVYLGMQGYELDVCSEDLPDNWESTH